MDADERERASRPGGMGAVFRGFLVLRLIGLVPLVIVAAVALGVRSLARGSDVVGVAVLVGAAVLAGAVGGVVVRGARRRR